VRFDTKMTVVALALWAFCGPAAGAEAVRHDILVVHDEHLQATEQLVLETFAGRLRKLGHQNVTLATEHEARTLAAAGEHIDALIVVGTIGQKPMTDFGLQPVLDAEGYCIEIGDNRSWTAESFPSAKRLAIVCGKDSHGLLFGLGKLLRGIDPTKEDLGLSPGTLSGSPAVADRVVYFATHFNNFYECAPLEDVLAYVEDLAFWGFNGIWTWFDMGWYPENFADDPTGKGALLLARIRSINEKARALGLSVGLIAIANEGFKSQPPPALLADPSDKRGGYYPESTICPSKPGGMEMILENKRRIFDGVGPIDTYVTWPYDQGSCGCAECRPWSRTFLKISERIDEEMKRRNPSATSLVSSWFFNDEDMKELLGTMTASPWIDGVVTDTTWPGRFEPPQGRSRLVFPEISMEGSLFVGYGASGSNPMPAKHLEQARLAAAHGYGAALYSEGIFEDVNKFVWACGLWDPRRTVEDVLGEYARSYFGADNAAAGSSLILGLEKTWPPEALVDKDPECVRSLYEQAKSLGAALPDDPSSRVRWQYLMDRAEMDKRMVDIGTDLELMRALKVAFTDAGYSNDPTALRDSLRAVLAQVAARSDAMKSLFQFHWEYLTRAHLDRSTTLIATPPTFIGQRDWDRLQAVLEGALQKQDDSALRADLLRGMREWFWHNNVTIDYIFL
jgi:hypothetical protein